jgi:hypothetical protein
MGAYMRHLFCQALQNCSFSANFGQISLSKDNANNRITSSTALSALLLNEARHINDMSRGSVLYYYNLANN